MFNFNTRLSSATKHLLARKGLSGATKGGSFSRSVSSSGSAPPCSFSSLRFSFRLRAPDTCITILRTLSVADPVLRAQERGVRYGRRASPTGFELRKLQGASPPSTGRRERTTFPRRCPRRSWVISAGASHEGRVSRMCFGSFFLQWYHRSDAHPHRRPPGRLRLP
jgi:hypothetical protein